MHNVALGPRKAFHILVVDDEEDIREMLQEAIGASGYRCSIAGDGTAALAELNRQKIDVVITDIKMPGMSGIELLSLVKAQYQSDVIVMTGYAKDYTYEKIIESGASDFIHKPFGIRELMVRLKRVLKERTLLFERNQKHQELKEAYLDTINRLVLAAEFRDETTGDHIVRMSRISAYLGKKLRLGSRMVQHLLYATPMHDVGKIGIPDSILMKPGQLTREEFEIMKTHTIIGARILANPKSEVLIMAHKIALYHHERWNGKGYPHGLQGEDIPLPARIVGLVDVYDALTSRRPYKPPYPDEVAIALIRKASGERFDPAVTEVFLESIDAIIRIRTGVNTRQTNLEGFTWSERDRKGAVI